MSNKLIRSLFEQRLAAWAAARSPALRVAFQGVSFTQAAGETYLACFLLPATTDSEDLAGVHRSYVGTWQVSIVRPSTPAAGLGVAGGIEDELAALFPLNLQLPSGAFSVYVRTPMSGAPALIDTPNTTIPVSCSYRADTI